jgi:ABC-type branched-subunit amino acid transport system substrate-binding protein
MRVPFACALLLASCSTDFVPQTCSVDNDCGNGLVCEVVNARNACVPASAATLVIGESAPISGTNQQLGTDMKLGIEMAFNEQNAAGGIRGRMLELDFRDDAYQPDLAETNARELTDAQAIANQAPNCPSTSAMIAGNTPVSTTALRRGPKAVLALLGNVGTPTMVRTAPIAVETGTVFFGAFTGASTVLRDTTCATCSKYIFNVRASYAQEARATMELFKQKGVPDYTRLISFDQNDTYGQAGYDGLVQAYTQVVGAFPSSADSTNPIVRFRYTRNDDTSVPAEAQATESYLANLLQNSSGTVTVGIMMTDTYGAGSDFIVALRTWQFANDSQQTNLNKANRLKLYFSNVSFVGPNALAQRLVAAGNVPNASIPFTQDVVVSQVVPNYESDSSDVVTSYNKLISMAGAMPSFTSLEGYVSARVFIAGLLAHTGPFTPDGMVGSFEALPDLSLGIGATSGFSPTNHQYSNSVWGTSIQPNGTFTNLYFWSVGIPIQFFE